MDVLQRCPATDSDNSATKEDFPTATHGIMGVLHQVMQVWLTVACLTCDQQTDKWTDGSLLFCRVIMRWRGRGSTGSSASTSACNCVCSNRMSDRYDRSWSRSIPLHILYLKNTCRPPTCLSLRCWTGWSSTGRSSSSNTAAWGSLSTELERFRNATTTSSRSLR